MKKFLLLILTLFVTAGCSEVGKTQPTAVTKTDVEKAEESLAEPKTEKTTTHKKSEKPPKNLILETLDNVEVYEKIKISDFVTDTNIEILNPDELISTNKLGVSEVYIDCLGDEGEFQQKVKYTVSDTTAPVILNMGTSPYTQKGEPFNLSEIVGFADNYDPVPTLTYDGTVDTDTVGIYPITAKITDNSGNETSWDMTIVVLNEIPDKNFSGSSDDSTTDFKDFVKTYEGENRQFGIDVSTWQGDIDFKAVKKAGCDFVIIRIAYYYDMITIDDCYLANIKNARDAGLKVGVYFYTTDNTADGIKEHAKWIAETLDGQELDFPVAFDWEEFTNFQEYRMSIHDLNELFNLFSAEMASHGYSAMLYSSKNFLENFWINDYNRPVWLAHFIDKTNYTGDYFMWQASCTGRIDGIDGDVDMNILYTDRPVD
ncbi:MAG: glycoside hydrolase family 25 [Ruminococcus sp.]|nr:glycoside hydrolase family 25 [Ruminococcus sp.]